jgi:Ca-activated chloride channel family protein
MQDRNPESEPSMPRQRLLVLTLSALLVVACARTAEQAKEPDEPGPAPAQPSTPQLESIEVTGSRITGDYKAEQAAAELEAEDRAAGAMKRQFASPDPLGPSRYAPMVANRENYAHFEDGSVLRVAEQPVSTFSIDVDTGSYSNVRRLLKGGALPRQDAVRVEEMINYFDYAYAPPRDRSQPFSVHAELAPAPWNAKTHLLRIGLQGWRPAGALPPSNLVFLVDVSGSMQNQDKLPLVKSSLKLLVNELDGRDRIALVVYAGASGVVLEPTPGDRKARIVAALDRLEAGGSTNGAAGIELAYAMAQQGFVRGGVNRVLLATDGDFNVGAVNFEQLKDLVEDKRKSGVALSTLGFGTGNYNDHLMEQLADAGNGNYPYVDGLTEARRALVQMRAATLQTIARDVKIQVEFNPAAVAEYRLIGYENRALKREDFNNDQVDAGDIGAGHSVTALYEIALRGCGPASLRRSEDAGTCAWRGGGERVEGLRYGARDMLEANPAELAFLRLRYKPVTGLSAGGAPDGDASRLIEQPITRAAIARSLDAASESLRFAAAVSAFGQLLRGGRYTERYGYADVLKLARAARGDDAQGWKGEFLQLVELASGLGTASPTEAGAGMANPASLPMGLRPKVASAGFAIPADGEEEIGD